MAVAIARIAVRRRPRDSVRALSLSLSHTNIYGIDDSKECNAEFGG